MPFEPINLTPSMKTSKGARALNREVYFLAASLVLLAFAILPIAALAQDAPLTRQQEWQRQREAKNATLKPHRPGSLEAGTLYVQKERVLERFAEGWKGWHPKLGGLSTGSGFAGGVRYAPRIAEGRVDFQTSGAISTRVYQFYDLKLGAPKLLDGKLFTEFYSRYRSYPQEDFFGFGPGSRKQDRTDFALEDSLVDFTLGRNWTRWLTTGLKAGYLKTNIGHGTDPRFPSTETVFSPTALPELLQQPNFYHTDAFFRIDYRDEPLNTHAGGMYQIAYAYYDDQKLDRHTFRRLDAEVQQHFPFLKKKRVISFRALASLADTSAGQSIPFYMMHEVGGADSLRGYREFRFRDRNLLVMNLEYRWEAFSGLDMAIFGDAGKVASRRRDINLKDLESDVGFGFRFNSIKSVFLRIDIGFSQEGTRVFFKFGPAF
ncbi:MAG: BamA/TamA family outer membrane protein [Acidobacteria bacterium]|nr:BamA/TamA family outer membrane protein [Acidobacteriota bacterium]MCI0723866.1 BamA/TamA family outer membrane protein [Acidobacteriota bacterium]